MYTQCPECATAFRVTADVLKQAAGKVRCGGCGIAFNALEFLSEQKPAQPVAAGSEAPLPELKPDPVDEPSPPKSISAEQSAALLKTLDELAGSDIRIEDTGVEWRVVDDDHDVAPEKPASAAADVADEDVDDELAETTEHEILSETGSVKWFFEEDGDAALDELLEQSPTPVDEVLDETPVEVESAEVFEQQNVATTEQQFESAEVFDPSATVTPVSEELRFDDNTPLPDDFDHDAPSRPTPPPPVVDSRDAPPEFDPQQVEIALGDADEWEQLLDEVDETISAMDDSSGVHVEAVAAAVDELAGGGENTQGSLSLAEELAALDEQIAADDEAPQAEQPLDTDSQFALQAEALGLDVGAPDAQASEKPEIMDDLDEVGSSVDEESGDEETSIEEDLIAAAFESEKEAREQATEVADEVDLSGEVIELEARDEDIELEVRDEDIELEVRDEDIELEVRDEDIELEVRDEDIELEVDGEDIDLEFTDDDVELDVTEEDIELELSDDVLDEVAAETAAVDEDGAVDGADEVDLDVELESLEAVDDGSDEPEADADETAAASDDEHHVPPQSEEEQTINAMIDQDLLALAGQGESGEALLLGADGEAPIVETIIMEGEFVRDALEEQALEEQRKAEEEEKARQPEAKESAEDLVAAAAEAERASSPRYGLVAGVIVLLLILIAQALHQNRSLLATIPAFSEAVAPLYRMAGRPVTPAWDITGWRFEATKGSTDEADSLLTIYSRVGNDSDKPLPYPLVSVSLTDRFEEIIGSRVLEPGDYLAANLDPSQLVAPGDTFDAVIAIESPDVDATGFKLNVCYPQPTGQLRCAVEDFK